VPLASATRNHPPGEDTWVLHSQDPGSAVTRGDRPPLAEMMTRPARRSSGWRLVVVVVYLFRNPLWLFGWVALIAAFVFQTLALHDGLISIVQPLLATELVFMLVLRRVWIHQSIRPMTWATAAVTCAGLAMGLPRACAPPCMPRPPRSCGRKSRPRTVGPIGGALRRHRPD
jgi:hypothetical protein